MTAEKPSTPICRAFENRILAIPLSDILPLRQIPRRTAESPKFRQILASIKEIGIVEPPVVVRLDGAEGQYSLLDGHLRIEVLRQLGNKEVHCLVATEDEAFTYNKRVNRIATIQEHKMILNAIKRGVPEERLAKALNLDISSIRKKRNLLVGICPEAAELLKDKQIAIQVFYELRRLKPLRQIEVAQIMIAMNTYTLSYAKSLVAATPQDQIVTNTRKANRNLNDEQLDLMRKETISLDREFTLAEERYGEDHLDLTLAIGYLHRLMSSAKIVKFLASRHTDVFSQFEELAQLHSAANQTD